MRFAWTLPITLGTVTGVHGMSDILATILAPLEVFRYCALLLQPLQLQYFIVLDGFWFLPGQDRQQQQQLLLVSLLAMEES